MASPKKPEAPESAALSPLARFARLLSGAEERFDLAEACLMIAEDAYPGLDIERYLGDIERMGVRLRARLPESADAEQRVIALNQFLFDDLGYAANAGDYYDPRNSYLNEVLERRTGIPITLAVIYMEVGRRIGLPLEGVSFPGHFLVRLKLRGGTLVLDPFSGGEPKSEDELRELLRRVVAGTGRSRDAANELPLGQFLEPAGRRQIVARVLRNLKGIHRQSQDQQALLEVMNRLIVAAPEAHVELRDRGLLYQQLEAFRAALQDLAAYLEREPEAPDATDIRARVVELTALCARLN